MCLHVRILVSLSLLCINKCKLQLLRNYQQVNGSFVLFICYYFLLTVCQCLSTITVTVRIMASEPLLNIFIFLNKWLNAIFNFFFFFPAVPKINRTVVPVYHYTPSSWVTEIGEVFLALTALSYGNKQIQQNCCHVRMSKNRALNLDCHFNNNTILLGKFLLWCLSQAIKGDWVIFKA